MHVEWFRKWRARQLLRRSFYRVQLADLPAGLEAAWRHEALQAYGGVHADAFFFACAAEGLMNYFEAVVRSEAPCALPSEAARLVWQAWRRHDAPGLERFCTRHFAGAIAQDRADAGTLLATLAACLAIDGMARCDDVPALFCLDERLRVPAGQGYWLGAEGVLHATLDGEGCGLYLAAPHPQLGWDALHAAGVTCLDPPAPAQRSGASASGAASGLVFSFGTTHVFGDDDDDDDDSADCEDDGGCEYAEGGDDDDDDDDD